MELTPDDLAVLHSGEFQEQMRETSRLLRENWKEVHLEQESHVAAFAAAGWTIPVVAPINFPSHFFATVPVSRFDEEMTAFYAWKRGRHFRELRKALLESPRLATWRPLLQECFAAYGKRRYKMIVPALLAVLEGLVLGGLAPGSRKTNVTGVLKSSMSHTAPGDFTWQLCLSVTLYVEHLFAWHPFDGTGPPRLNRHWVLHGRASSDWGHLESLQLFNAIHSLDLAVEYWPQISPFG